MGKILRRREASVHDAASEKAVIVGKERTGVPEAM